MTPFSLFPIVALMEKERNTLRIYRNPRPAKITAPSADERAGILAFHRALPGYDPTPLVSIKKTAQELGFSDLLVKDEGRRFGLKAFKALGASHAVYHLLKRRCGGNLTPDEFLASKGRAAAEGLVFTCATDGNHGRALAWIARLLERPAVIYVPRDTVPARIRAIEAEGGEVIVVEGGYDEAVRCASVRGEREDWAVVADVGYDGYEELPIFIQQGYLTIFEEVASQLRERHEMMPDHIFIQAGVGAFASAAAWFFSDPVRGVRLISVEPLAADCLLASARADDGRVHTVRDNRGTIMAGLNCETPSSTAWEPVHRRFDAYLSIDDHYAEEAMRILAAGGIVAGESGAAGLAALLALRAESPDLAERELSLVEDSRILVINTEADTDPEGYERIVGETGFMGAEK